MIKLSEEAWTNEIESNSELFYKIFHSSPIAMSIVRISDNAILETNESFLQIINQTREEAIGKAVLEMTLWTNMSQRDEILDLLNKNGSVRDFEFDYKTADLSFRYGLMYASAIVYRGERCVLFQALDITARKLSEDKLTSFNLSLQNEADERLSELKKTSETLWIETEKRALVYEALTEQQERYKEIFENSPFGIYRTTVDGNLIAANPAFASILKFDNPQEAIQEVDDVGLQLFVDPSLRDSFLENIVKSNTHVVFDMDLYCKNRNIISARLRSHPVHDEAGEIVYIEGFLENVTERKLARKKLEQLNDELEDRIKARTSELQAANKELESFAYTVSHDLRAPLRAIDGFSQALYEDYIDELDGEAKDYLKRIRNASQRMAELIDDILVLSRITRSEMNIQAINLSEIAEYAVAELREREPNRDLDIKIQSDMLGVGDPHLITILLENLIGNAWKFTSKIENAKIEFGAKFNGEHFYYYVKDNGAGFDMNYADKLFKAFNRLHRNDEFDGTGVGLATAARILQRHCGEIWGEGEIDKGATFYFSLGE